MSLSSFTVVSNALRLRLFQPKQNGTKPVPETKASPACCTGAECDQTIETEETNMKKVLNVEGMMCQHCQARVEKALSAVDGVDACQVDLAAKTATCTLSAPVEDAVLTKAVTDAGYEVTGVQG
jgi:copper chaperone CopZ